MTDEDESTDPGIIVAAERAILKFLRDREANEAAPEDRGTSTVNQFAQHPAPANPVKKTKTIEELAALAILFGFDHAPLTNKARAVFFDANNDIFDEEVFVATLDSHTTPICRATDGTR